MQAPSVLTKKETAILWIHKVYHYEEVFLMSKTAVISKWGNAQGLRLPKVFCRQLGISVGDKVSLSIEDDKLVISTI
jgi:hypothetical protein